MPTEEPFRAVDGHRPPTTKPQGSFRDPSRSCRVRKHAEISHNPWVVGSNPTRPTVLHLQFFRGRPCHTPPWTSPVGLLASVGSGWARGTSAAACSAAPPLPRLPHRD